ncbi:hypothetical protein AE32_03427 [Acinetobacter nosocomialis]|uniref:Uncharacterized protein n=1 Tax=Acinetobacter nosocomialis TaxID=106654 RepID=A0A836MHT2_ACINO|nr:hypothetical protein AE32_03427 [Acinetobacter nosocomialis]
MNGVERKILVAVGLIEKNMQKKVYYNYKRILEIICYKKQNIEIQEDGWLNLNQNILIVMFLSDYLRIFSRISAYSSIFEVNVGSKL